MLLENLINTDHGVRGDRLAVVLTVYMAMIMLPILALKHVYNLDGLLRC